MNKAFLQRAIDTRGEEGKEWIKKIPKIIDEYQIKWNITVDSPFILSYNYATPAHRADGTQAVLKIGFAGDEGFTAEIKALRVFNGDGIVKLLEADIENAVMLLERLLPGETVKNIDDEKSTVIAADLMKRAWKPVPQEHSFINLSDWFKGYEMHRKRFNGTSGPLSSQLFLKGEKLFSELLQTTEKEMLLHGDLHHGNILSATREPWVGIDPKGVIGDPAYETTAFLRNPYPEFLKRKNPKKDILRRIEIFSHELNIDAERIRKWGIAQCVLSAVWEIKDNGKDWEYDMRCAELL
jgi:streptomycin 6-kinase